MTCFQWRLLSLKFVALMAMALGLAASTSHAANSWDGGANTNWWFNPVNWSHDSGCPNAAGICYLPPGQDSGGTLVRNDTQINSGTGAWNVTGEGVVYDPVNDPFFGAASSLRYPTGSALVAGSVLARDYGPQTLYRLYISRGTASSNTLTIKSGDLAVESTTIIGRSGSTATTQNLGRVVQTGGTVRFPLTGVDLGQREASTGTTPGWGNGVWDYRGGTLEISQEGTGALRLSAGSATVNVGPGGRGTMIVHNPTSGGHVSSWNVMSASYAGVVDATFDPLMDPDGVNFGVGVFEFHYENGGTRPFQVLNNLSLNNGLDSTTQGTRSSRLDLRLDAAPLAPGGIPQNLGLIDVDSDQDGAGLIQGVGSLGGTFSSADGLTNYAESSMVSAIFGSTKYNWAISYSGNITHSDLANSVISAITGATTGRDIVLMGLSTETVIVDVLGDFNDDGRVDAADYTRWRDNLGNPSDSVLSGNGDAVPGVGLGDYTVWKNNFGAGTGSGSFATTSVPEPSTILMVMLSLCGLAGLRRRVS